MIRRPAVTNDDLLRTILGSVHKNAKCPFPHVFSCFVLYLEPLLDDGTEAGHRVYHEGDLLVEVGPPIVPSLEGVLVRQAAVASEQIAEVALLFRIGEQLSSLCFFFVGRLFHEGVLVRRRDVAVLAVPRCLGELELGPAARRLGLFDRGVGLELGCGTCTAAGTVFARWRDDRDRRAGLGSTAPIPGEASGALTPGRCRGLGPKLLHF